MLLASGQSESLSAFIANWELFQARLVGTGPVQKCGVGRQKRPLGEHKIHSKGRQADGQPGRSEKGRLVGWKVSTSRGGQGPS